MVRETRHLWVGNLPDNIREDRIREHFKRYGRVQSVKLLPRGGKEETGEMACTVAFMDIKSASKAHTAEHKLDDRTLTTEYYEPAAIPSSSSPPNASGATAASGYATTSPSTTRFPNGHSSADEHGNFTERFYDRTNNARVPEGDYIRRPGYHDTTRGRNRDRSFRNGPYNNLMERHRPVNNSWPYDSTRYNNQANDTGYNTTPTDTNDRRSEQSTKKKTKSRSGSRTPSPSESTSSRSPSRSRSRSSSSSSSSTSRETSSTGSPKSRRLQSNNPAHQPVVHSEDRRPLAICVRNLPLRSSDTSLKDGLFHEYKKHGKVTWVKVVGQSSERHAIVCFKKPEDAEKALEVSYDKLFFGCKIEVAPYQGYDVEDNDLRPYEAEIDEFHPKATRTLFIGNLEKDVTASDLRKHFDQFGEIIEIDIKKQGVVSSYAFCQYSDIVSVVKAIRTMDGEHLNNNRIKLGFGKSMPTQCVWVDGVSETVTDKYLSMQFDPFGVVVSTFVDREKGQALIFFDQVVNAQAAVTKMRGVGLRGRKIQVDFASRECQEAFFENLEKQGLIFERPGFDERRDSTTRSFDSSTRFSRYVSDSPKAPGTQSVICNRYDTPTRPRTASYSSRTGAPTSQCNTTAVPSPGTPGSATPRGTGSRSRLTRYDYYDANSEYPERHFRSYDEYSQGSAASHEEGYDHEGVYYESPSHIEPIENRIPTTEHVMMSFAQPDIRNLQKERVLLLEQLEECPSSGDELISPKKRLKLEHLDGTITSDVIIEANRDHRKVMEVRRSSDASLKHLSRRPSVDGKHIGHERGSYLPHSVCKRRKTGGSDSGRVHHYESSESVGGSRPGTPLCDERPEHFTPSEPRRIPREREGPLTLPLPRFALQMIGRGSISIAGIKGQKENILSSPPPAVTSPRISNPKPPSPTPVPPPASPPPRPPSLSSNSSDSDGASPSPSLDERIKSLDEKYEKWSGSRAFTTSGIDASAKFDFNKDRFKFKHKLLDLDFKELQPSEIVKSVMAKRSVFDEDSKRLENVGEKYEPKDFAMFPRTPVTVQTTVPATTLSTLPLLKVCTNPVPPTMLSPRSTGAPLTPAKGLQYPFPTHPPMQPSPSSITTTTPTTTTQPPASTTPRSAHSENRLKLCANAPSDNWTPSKVNVHRNTSSSVVVSNKTSDANIKNIPPTSECITVPAQTEPKTNNKINKVCNRRDSANSENKSRRNSDTSRRPDDNDNCDNTEVDRQEKIKTENEKIEKENAERAELERIEREEKERQERLEKERIEKEREEKERRENEEREEKERREREERERREREEKEQREREEKERREREEQLERERRERKEREEKERRDREERERREKEEQLERERKREEERKHKEDNQEKHKHRENHSENKNKDNNLDVRNTKEDKKDNHISRKDSHDKSRYLERDLERRKESIKENRENHLHEKAKNLFNEIREGKDRPVLETHHASLDLEKKDPSRRKERNNSLPASLGSKRRLSSHDGSDCLEEAKKIKLSTDHRKISERRDSKDSKNKHKSTPGTKNYDEKSKHNHVKDSTEEKRKEKDREREERHKNKQIKTEKQKIKSKNREKDSRESPSTPKSPAKEHSLDKDFLARLDLIEVEKQKQIQRKEPKQEDKKIENECKRTEERKKEHKSREDTPKSSDEQRKVKKERIRKLTNSSENSDSDEPKKHSIFDIVDDEPAYISMYDKVKARSCKNMQKQEEEKRQEKIKAKFSQLKQSRAKREEKKRSTSWDEDSESDVEREKCDPTRRKNKMMIASSDEENDMPKQVKKEIFTDSDSDRNRQTKSEMAESSDDDHIKNMQRKSSKSKITSDTSDDDYKKPPNKIKTELFSENEEHNFADSEEKYKKIKEEFDEKYIKKKNNKYASEIDQIFGEGTASEIKEEKFNNSRRIYENSSADESLKIEPRKKHKKKQKKQKSSASCEESSKVDSESLQSDEKCKNPDKRKQHSKKEKKRDKVKDENRAKKSKKSKSDSKDFRRDGKMENIFGSLSDDSEGHRDDHDPKSFERFNEESIQNYASDSDSTIQTDQKDEKDRHKMQEDKERLEKDRFLKEEHRKRKEKKRRDKEKRLREEHLNENSLDYIDMGKQLEDNIKDDSNEIPGELKIKNEIEDSHPESNPEDVFRFSEETSESRKDSERKEAKEKKKKRKKSKDEKQRHHHHHHHHDKNKLKSPEIKKEESEIKTELINSPPTTKTSSNLDVSVSPQHREAIISPIPKTPTNSKEKKREKFIPGFGGDIDEKIHENAVKSISEFDAPKAESPIISPPKNEVKNEKSETVEEKPRVIISQEETEDAVAALLGESFGHDQFNDYEQPQSPVNEQNNVPEENVQDDEEMRQAVQSLNSGEMEIKPETPQSEHELQIDTDTEEQEEITTRYDPPRTPEMIDISQPPKTPDIPSYFRKEADKSMPNINSPPSLTPIKQVISSEAKRQLEPVKTCAAASLPLITEPRPTIVVSKPWTVEKSEVKNSTFDTKPIQPDAFDVLKNQQFETNKTYEPVKAKSSELVVPKTVIDNPTSSSFDQIKLKPFEQAKPVVSTYETVKIVTYTENQGSNPTNIFENNAKNISKPPIEEKVFEQKIISCEPPKSIPVDRMPPLSLQTTAVIAQTKLNMSYTTSTAGKIDMDNIPPLKPVKPVISTALHNLPAQMPYPIPSQKDMPKISTTNINANRLPITPVLIPKPVQTTTLVLPQPKTVQEIKIPDMQKEIRPRMVFHQYPNFAQTRMVMPRPPTTVRPNIPTFLPYRAISEPPKLAVYANQTEQLKLSNSVPQSIPTPSIVISSHVTTTASTLKPFMPVIQEAPKLVSITPTVPQPSIIQTVAKIQPVVEAPPTPKEEKEDTLKVIEASRTSTPSPVIVAAPKSEPETSKAAETVQPLAIEKVTEELNLSLKESEEKEDEKPPEMKEEPKTEKGPPACEKDKSSVIKQTEKFDVDTESERLSTDIKEDPLDSKEDSDYWSAKEVNIDSVIKKVDALCSADELSDRSSEISKDDWMDDKPDTKLEPEKIDDSKSDEHEILDGGHEMDEKEIATRGRRGGRRGGRKIGRGAPGGMTTRRGGKAAKEVPSRGRGGRGGRPKNDRKVTKSESEDIYEFRDESDDGQNKDRPRLILTIKSPAVANANGNATIVKEVLKDVAASPQPVVTTPLKPSSTELKEEFVSPANTRKSRRLQERDVSRNTVDDTIEDVVKNTVLTRAAAAGICTRRSTRQTPVKVQTELNRKLPRGGRKKDRRASENNEDSSEEKPIKPECVPKEPSPEHSHPTETDLKEKSVADEAPKMDIREKPHEGLKATMLRRVKGEMNLEPMTLIDPVTGVLTPMRECEEGRYIPLQSQNHLQNAAKVQVGVAKVTDTTTVISSPSQTSVVKQHNKPQSLKAHVLSKAATAKQVATTQSAAVNPPVVTPQNKPISQNLSVNVSLPNYQPGEPSSKPTPPLAKPIQGVKVIQPPVSPNVMLPQQKQQIIIQVAKTAPKSQLVNITVNSQLAHVKPTGQMSKSPLMKPHMVPQPMGASPPLKQHMLAGGGGARMLTKPGMDPPKVDVSIGAQCVMVPRSNSSPQNQQRHVLTTGIPLPTYEATLHGDRRRSPPPAHQNSPSPQGEGIAHFTPGSVPLRPPHDLPPAHYMHQSQMMYQQYLRQPYSTRSPIISGGLEKPGDGQEGEEAPVTSPPLELRRSVGLAMTNRSSVVPLSLQSPHDRTTDSPQVGQVYSLHPTRLPFSQGRFYDPPGEPPPAHRQISSLGLTNDRALSHMGPLGTPDRPLSTHSALASHMGNMNTPERPLSTHIPERPLSTHIPERPLSTHLPERPVSTHLPDRSVTTLIPERGMSLALGAGLGAAGNIMGAVARHVGPDASASQRGLQAATPPHASQVPPQAESLLMLLRQYPLMWQGLLALKNDQAAVQMYFVSGNDQVAKISLPRNMDGSTPPLRIFQRMRLEPPQVEGVARKMQMENEHCMLLALPCGRDHMDVLKQSNYLTNGFITYLRQKQAAGIVNVAAPGTTQPPAYVVHIFPSCDFVNENLRRIAPSLLERVADIAHLLIVITTV